MSLRVPEFGFAQQFLPFDEPGALLTAHTLGLAFHDQTLDRVIAQIAELYLAFQAVAHVFDDYQEADDEQYPQHPSGKHHHLFSGGHREYEYEHDRHDESRDERTALEFRIQHGESARLLLDGFAVSALVGKYLNCLGDVVSAFLELHFFADDHVAFRDLPCEQLVEVGEQRPDDQPDEERRSCEQQQRAYRLEPVPVIETGDGLAERVD